MSVNPYSAPVAEVGRDSHFEAPADVTSKIKNCWMAALVSMAITTLVVALTNAGMFAVPGINAWALIDVFVVGILAFGVYRRSRVSAVLLFALFILQKVLMLQAAGTVSGAPLALVILWFYGQGIVGTFQYQRLRKAFDQTGIQLSFAERPTP